MALNLELMADAIADTPQLLRKGYEEAMDDRRFAEAIYRVALASGLMGQVGYQDTIADLGDFDASIALRHHATAFVSLWVINCRANSLQARLLYP